MEDEHIEVDKSFRDKQDKGTTAQKQDKPQVQVNLLLDPAIYSQRLANRFSRNEFYSNTSPRSTSLHQAPVAFSSQLPPTSSPKTLELPQAPSPPTSSPKSSQLSKTPPPPTSAHKSEPLKSVPNPSQQSTTPPKNSPHPPQQFKTPPPPKSSPNPSQQSKTPPPPKSSPKPPQPSPPPKNSSNAPQTRRSPHDKTNPDHIRQDMDKNKCCAAKCKYNVDFERVVAFRKNAWSDNDLLISKSIIAASLPQRLTPQVALSWEGVIVCRKTFFWICGLSSTTFYLKKIKLFIK
eukprot:TRINITY_DN869_c0_g1_i6.p1 TRINITY_DN869_c0_g1~~TRINITY_DN869_c0_g1_i6.p1  ORF type:complete len:291 (-),score=-41.87 TRINITY_DN869_c0_g1_i6:25-897(-)